MFIPYFTHLSIKKNQYNQKIVFKHLEVILLKSIEMLSTVIKALPIFSLNLLAFCFQKKKKKELDFFQVSKIWKLYLFLNSFNMVQKTGLTCICFFGSLTTVLEKMPSNLFSSSSIQNSIQKSTLVKVAKYIVFGDGKVSKV